MLVVALDTDLYLVAGVPVADDIAALEDRLGALGVGACSRR